jgi:hypothetical protein
LLKTHTHVHVISFDYSKAFDTVSHASVANSVGALDLPDNIYNWTVDFLSHRTHSTLFGGTASSSAGISAGVIQGSVLGPTLFNHTASDLKPVSDLNKMFKYADDGYLIVPGSNAISIAKEIDHHLNWAKGKNLRLNVSKTSEIVFCRKRSPQPPPTPGIVRVTSMKILGVNVDDKLNFQGYVNEMLTSCCQSLFPLRTLRHHGLSDAMLQVIFSAKILPKILYAVSAWWGFLNLSTVNQVEGFLRKASRFNFYSNTRPGFVQLAECQDQTLFRDILSNDMHCLRFLLPQENNISYNLRKRGHSYYLPPKDDRNFMTRCLYKYK